MRRTARVDLLLSRTYLLQCNLPKTDYISRYLGLTFSGAKGFYIYDRSILCSVSFRTSNLSDSQKSALCDLHLLIILLVLFGM